MTNHALLEAFKARTGCPVGFNVCGEPIVCTPADACFLGTDLDCLAIGHCFLRKAEQDLSLKRVCRLVRARLTCQIDIIGASDAMKLKANHDFRRRRETPWQAPGRTA